MPGGTTARGLCVYCKVRRTAFKSRGRYRGLCETCRRRRKLGIDGDPDPGYGSIQRSDAREGWLSGAALLELAVPPSIGLIAGAIGCSRGEAFKRLKEGLDPYEADRIAAGILRHAKEVWGDEWDACKADRRNHERPNRSAGAEAGKRSPAAARR